MEWVKRNTLRWFGHNDRMGSEEFVKKVYVSESEGPNSRGRVPGRWKDRVSVGSNGRGRLPERWRERVKEYMCERGGTRGGGLDQAQRECLDRERWRLSCCGHPLGRRSWRERGVRAIDR